MLYKVCSGHYQVFDVVQHWFGVDSLLSKVGPEGGEGPLVSLPHLGVVVVKVGAAVLVNTVVGQVRVHVRQRTGCYMA